MHRQLKYKTSEELEAGIEAYFKSLEYEYEGQTLSKPATITGLAHFLGFCDRQSFYDYEKRGTFSCTVKRARLYIESKYEEGLQGKAPTGCIFALKNFGWKDKTEVTSEITVNTIKELTDEELEEKLRSEGIV